MFGRSKKDLFFVGMQVLLFALYLIPISPGNLPVHYVINSIGLVAALTGVVVVVIATFQLNKNLTPFPTPKEGGALVTKGLYKFVRHPIYTGIILTTVGYSLYVESLWKLLISIILFTVFYYKSKWEEDLLSARYEDYKDYMKTTGRFIPYM